jgi:hypothetical protein
MHLHPIFHVGLLKPYVHDTQSSRIRPAPMPDLFADEHEEWEVSAIVSRRWRAPHLQYIVSWVRFAEHENSWALNLTWPILLPWSPSTGPLTAVPALRSPARGNAGARPEDVPLLKKGGIVAVR